MWIVKIVDDTLHLQPDYSSHKTGTIPASICH